MPAWMAGVLALAMGFSAVATGSLSRGLALWLALLAAWKPGSVLDNVARLISLLGYSVPVFWLGLLGLLLFYAVLHWSAGPGRLDDIWIYTLEPKTGLVLKLAASLVSSQYLLPC